MGGGLGGEKEHEEVISKGYEALLIFEESL